MSASIRAAVRGALVSSILLAPFAAQAAAPVETSGLEEVVVTAQFRQERLQNTPIAISAFTAADMESRGLANVTDLGAYIPNAVIQPLGAGWGATMAAFVRGVGLGDNILSFEPGVPIYIDDVYVGRPQGAMFDLLDLERTEALRGPQGTLFGKNAVGGTIRMISKKPQGDDSGSVSLTVGSFNRIDARAMADVSIIPDRLFARFSFSSKRADGWFKVLDYVCVNGPNSLGTGGTGIPGVSPPIHLQSSLAPNSGCVADTLNDENVQSARAAFRFLINDQAEFNLVADVTNQNQKGPADKYTVIAPGINTFWSSVFVAPIYGAGVAYDSRFLTNSLYTNYSAYNDPLTGRSVPNINNLLHWGVAGTLDWKLSDNVNLKSVTAYRTFRNEYGRDSDGSPLPSNFTYDDARHRQFSEELQLTGTAGDLSWAAGAFYYDAFDSDRGFDSLYPTVIYQNDGYDRQTTRNWALFTQDTYHISDKLSVTGGVRYTNDEKDATIYRASFGGTVLINNVYVPLSSANTDYTVSVDYKWTDALMTYAKYATGFKGGGFSPRPSDSLQTVPFKPEYLKTFELGEKSQFLNNTVRLNTAFFYSKYLDQQTFAQQLDALNNNWFREENAGTARIWGLEGELQAEPVTDLRIDASVGYTNYLLTSNGGNVLLFTGNHCGGDTCYSPRTPKYKGAVGVQYGFDLAGGKLTPRLDATYQSKIYFTTNNGCANTTDNTLCGSGAQDAYTLLNGRITWESESKAWEIAAYGRNLTDKGYFNGKLSLIGFFGREQGNPGAPRELGITFKRNFK